MRLGPFIQARDDMDEVFERFFGGGPSGVRSNGYDVPTDVFHTKEALMIRMDLPGVDPDKVDVTVQENVLIINGSRPFPYEGQDIRWVRRGTFYGDFTQRVVLGKGLKLDAIKAAYDSGVLELTIPYAEEVQPRKIAIDITSQPKQLSGN
jgi:HSP20 family protein